jgi:HD-GYP domain-containing protein (c-di-GMP phosphodiesterase class II)
MELNWHTVSDWSQVTPASGAPSVLALDAALAGAAGAAEALRGLPGSVAVIAQEGAAARVAEEQGSLFLVVAADAGPDGWRRALRAAAQHAVALTTTAMLERERQLASAQLVQLGQVGGALMEERDLDSLLERILREARRLTGSDAGSLYLLEERDDDEQELLRFRLTQNDSLGEIRQPDMTLPVDASSLAGYAASTGETLRIDDAYLLPPDVPYAFDPRLDERTGYRTRALLVVPMRTPDGRSVGVLQLINPANSAGYGERDGILARSLCGQAAVAIENNRLNASIEELFEGFVRAAVGALDQRDPTGRGHSLRVAELTCGLAQRVDLAGGRLIGIRFSPAEMRELRYAALLHDFGKVGVPEEVLGKERKLTVLAEARLRGRIQRGFDLMELRLHRERARLLEQSDGAGIQLLEKRLQESLDAERARLRAFERAVLIANEPRVLPESERPVLEELAAEQFLDGDGRELTLLEAPDVDALGTQRGSLTAEERLAIQSHVTLTHQFLEQIPWTRDLKRVDEIAHGHHEMLDGSGYPRQLRAPEIPVQTRILTIADIFDALTAADRPYKPAVSPERAIDILRDEAGQGRLDPELLEVFQESQLWRHLLQR